MVAMWLLLDDADLPITVLAVADGERLTTRKRRMHLSFEAECVGTSIFLSRRWRLTIIMKYVLTNIFLAYPLTTLATTLLQRAGTGRFVTPLCGTITLSSCGHCTYWTGLTACIYLPKHSLSLRHQRNLHCCQSCTGWPDSFEWHRSCACTR